MEIVIENSAVLSESIERAVDIQLPRTLASSKNVLDALRMLAGSIEVLGVSSGLFVSEQRERFWVSATDFALHLAVSTPKALRSCLGGLDLRRTSHPLQRRSTVAELLERFRHTNSLTVYLCSPSSQAEGSVLAKDILKLVADYIDPKLTVGQFTRYEGAVQCTTQDEWTLSVPAGEPAQVYSEYRDLLKRFLGEGKRFAVELDADGRIEMGSSLARTVLAMGEYPNFGLGAVSNSDGCLTRHLTDVPTASQDQSLKTLVQIMIAGPYMWSPVVDQEGRYAGIVEAQTIVNSLKFK